MTAELLHGRLFAAARPTPARRPCSGGLGGLPEGAAVCAFARAKRYPDRVEAIFSVLQIAISVVLVLLVLMHSGKDAGLSGAFGAGSGQGPLGGGSMVERNLNRWTIFFAVLFFLNAILLLKAPWS